MSLSVSNALPTSDVSMTSLVLTPRSRKVEDKDCIAGRSSCFKRPMAHRRSHTAPSGSLCDRVVIALLSGRSVDGRAWLRVSLVLSSESMGTEEESEGSEDATASASMVDEAVDTSMVDEAVDTSRVHPDAQVMSLSKAP